MAKINTKFSIWLVNELLKRGWTVNDLAERSGLAASTIQRIIDHKGDLGLRAMHQLAKAIGVTERDLVEKFDHSEIFDELGYFLDEVIRNTINLSARDKAEILAFIRFKKKMAKKYDPKISRRGKIRNSPLLIPILFSMHLLLDGITRMVTAV